MRTFPFSSKVACLVHRCSFERKRCVVVALDFQVGKFVLGGFVVLH